MNRKWIEMFDAFRTFKIMKLEDMQEDAKVALVSIWYLPKEWEEKAIGVCTSSLYYPETQVSKCFFG